VSDYVCERNSCAWTDGTHVAFARMRDEEHGVEATVTPRAGGEISSLRVRWQGRWVETLYRAMEFAEPEAGWRGRAPLLWPAVGRNYVPEDVERVKALGEDLAACSYALHGRIFHIPCHGFARDLPWDLVSCGVGADSAWCECRLCANGITRAMYPFDFDLSVRHEVTRGSVVSRYRIRSGDNHEPMFFSIGNHITFRVPFLPDGKYEHVTVTSPSRSYAEIDDQSLLTGRCLERDLSTGGTLAESDLLNLVLCGYEPSTRFVEMADPASFGMRVSQEEVAADGEQRFAPEHVYFVFYGDAEQGLFCPEPWLGGPNSLNTGLGVARLESGEAFEWLMTITPLL